MAGKLAVVVLGERNAGKSTTWNALFGRTVRTGDSARDLIVDERWRIASGVFLVSGSAEERKTYVEQIVKDRSHSILLISVQYADGAERTLSWLRESGYEVFCQWLNPGYGDSRAYLDRLGFAPRLLADGVALVMRPAKELADRVDQIKDVILGWALRRGLAEELQQ